MSDPFITTSTGTEVSVVDRFSNRVVMLDNPAAPDDMRQCEAGRILDGGFQPAPFALRTLRPEVLRVIADLVEQEKP